MFGSSQYTLFKRNHLLEIHTMLSLKNLGMIYVRFIVNRNEFH